MSQSVLEPVYNYKLKNFFPNIHLDWSKVYHVTSKTVTHTCIIPGNSLETGGYTT